MDTNKLITEARDTLSLLARMALSRATMEHKARFVLIHLDQEGWQAMRISRIREEIERAVQEVYGTEVRFD